MVFVVLAFLFVVFMLVGATVGSMVNSLGFGAFVALIVVVVLFVKMTKD